MILHREITSELVMSITYKELLSTVINNYETHYTILKNIYYTMCSVSKPCGLRVKKLSSEYRGNITYKSFIH
jgi:hypothetical protein